MLKRRVDYVIFNRFIKKKYCFLILRPDNGTNYNKLIMKPIMLIDILSGDKKIGKITEVNIIDKYNYNTFLDQKITGGYFTVKDKVNVAKLFNNYNIDFHKKYLIYIKVEI